MATRCLTLAILILAARPAAPQTANAPRVELGGTFSAILPIVPADGPAFLIGGGPRVGANLTRTIGMQGSLEMLGPFGDRDGINGIYGADARFAMRHGQRGQRTLSLSPQEPPAFAALDGNQNDSVHPALDVVFDTQQPLVVGQPGHGHFERWGAGQIERHVQAHQLTLHVRSQRRREIDRDLILQRRRGLLDAEPPNTAARRPAPGADQR